MRLSQGFVSTRKDDPRDAVSNSHKLLVRAGYIHQLSAGIFIYLPLMWRVILKIESIIRQEMERIDAFELNLPILQPKTIWAESGRWSKYLGDKFLFHLTDRRGEEFCLAPTAEETITDLVRTRIRSYRDLPLILFQIGNKYRDELRPRFGIVRVREFIMKDAYSFDRDESGMRQSFAKMQEVYHAIFRRCGINILAVEADSGDIGGAFSSEFMLPTETGEDVFLKCSQCLYGANIEKAQSVITSAEPEEPQQLVKYLADTSVDSQQSSGFPNHLPPDKILRTVFYRVDQRLVAVLIRSDQEINERKLERYIGTSYFVLADADEIRGLTGTDPAYASPFGLPGLEIIADDSVSGLSNFTCGANETGHFLSNMNFGRDLKAPTAYVDLRNAHEGDGCPRCSDGRLMVSRGIEIGHIFQLGHKYSQPMALTFLDHDGLKQYVWMGCYGIGVARIAAAAVEQFYDKYGIVWPEAIAPYRVIITPVSWEDPIQRDLAESIYRLFNEAGIEVALDDRQETAGFKFKDADLLGIPWRITVGRLAKEGLVELKNRRSGSITKCQIHELLSVLNGG